MTCIRDTDINLSMSLVVCIKVKFREKSVYADQPKEQNPVEGKKVIFVENQNDSINADGKCGHLEAVGEAYSVVHSGSEYRTV